MLDEISNDKSIVNILWTGGFDSTFRIVQLSQCEVKIQPYYLSDERKSEEYELKAIEQIMKRLKEHNMTKCSFAPLILVDKCQREEKKEISEAFERILERDFIGSQYKWLGSFSMKYPGIELSVHEDDKAIGVIKKYGRLTLCKSDAEGEYYVVDCKQSSLDICLLFGNFHFPLVDFTKVQMKKFYIDNGYEDVMNLTWFCHAPIKGEPCGVCNPCRYTIEEGLKERFTKKALFRYYMQICKDKLFEEIRKYVVISQKNRQNEEN